MDSNIYTTPCRWVKPRILEAMTGYTAEAIRKKRSRKVWLEGNHWKVAPDGNYIYDWREIENWMVGR
jgi:hypothetical protein